MATAAKLAIRQPLAPRLTVDAATLNVIAKRRIMYDSPVPAEAGHLPASVVHARTSHAQ